VTRGLRSAALLAAAWALAGACGDPEPVARARVAPAVLAAIPDPATLPGSAIGHPYAAAATLCVDTARSLVRWRGTKVGGSHAGVVRVAGGRIRLADGAIRGGDVTVDMRTIAVTDIPPDQPVPRARLRAHLSHEEFFGVDRFPTARFVLTGVEPAEHGTYDVSGDLAIRDSVHNVTFQAAAPVVKPDELWASASFGIDRQLWGIDFDGRTSALRNALVHDLIQLEVSLVARRDACAPQASAGSAESLHHPRPAR
jgi:polyisoprenoid-binding protein YceI